jgi:hypothetical protein
MQGEQIFFDLPALCRGADVPLEQVLRQASAVQGG